MIVPPPQCLMCQTPDELAARCHKVFHSTYDAYSHGWVLLLSSGRSLPNPMNAHAFSTSTRADLQTTVICSGATSWKENLSSSTYTTLLCLSSWCNVSESRRSGEAEAEQCASGSVLGPSPKHCLRVQGRAGQNHEGPAADINTTQTQTNL